MARLERGEDAADDECPTVNDAAAAFLAAGEDRKWKWRTEKRYRSLLQPSNNLESFDRARERAIPRAGLSERRAMAWKTRKPPRSGFFTAAYGRLAVSAVTISTIDDFRKTRRCSGATWRLELSELRLFFKWCMARKWCRANPTKDSEMPPLADLVTLPYTNADVQSLMKAAANVPITSRDGYARKRAVALVYALLYSGLRISDVAKLRRDALDLDTGHLTLRIQKTGVPIKTKLNQRAVDALLAVPASNPDYFFWSGPASSNLNTCIIRLSRVLTNLGTETGIHCHAHRFRDTFAVELITNRAEMRTVQLLLGHKSIKTTEAHYAHFVPGHQLLLDAATDSLNFERPHSGSGPVPMHSPRDRRRYA